MKTHTEKYSKRGKCTMCTDIVWIEEDSQSVQCNCGNTSITEGVLNNCIDIDDSEMILYLARYLPNDAIIVIEKI